MILEASAWSGPAILSGIFVAVAAGVILRLLTHKRLPRGASPEDKAADRRQRVKLGGLAALFLVVAVAIYVFPPVRDTSSSPGVDGSSTSAPPTPPPAGTPSPTNEPTTHPPSPTFSVSSPGPSTRSPNPPAGEALTDRKAIRIEGGTSITLDKDLNVGSSLHSNSIRMYCDHTCNERPMYVDYNIGGDYSTLKAVIGISDDAEEPQQILKLTVLLDQQEYRSWTFSLQEGKAYEPIEIPVTNVTRLGFVATYGGDNPARDTNVSLDAVLGQPKLYR